MNLPNLYMVHLRNQAMEMEVAAVSTGGGMMEVIRINGTALSLKGDRDVDLWINPKGELITDASTPSDALRCRIPALLPTRFQKDAKALFASCQQMLDYNKARDLSAWELAAAYESRLGGIKEEEVFQKMHELYQVMRKGVRTGLQGTSFKDRIYGAQSLKYQKQMEAGSLAGDQVVHHITLYVSALMEVKSSMGVIIAAPTAGSCGTFPGAVLGVADAMKLEEEQIVKALLAGSLTGIFIATASTFSAEIGGCQAECGSGAGMAAAAIASLLGGNVEQCMAASSLALQNSLGMICDPIAARVEAPCLGKNTSSALNALASANMVMAGYDHLIPLDEVIETMDKVGKSLPRELRCTALGGLAVTPSAREIEKRLADQQRRKS
jgi:L-serine dehydratase